MLQKPLDYWKTVIWSDESKFTVFQSNGKVMVWRNTKEAFDPKCTAPTVKHGSASVMVWGCFTRWGVGKLHILDRMMNRFYYREIFETDLLPSIAAFGFPNGFAFMHDNDPKHTAGVVKDWLIRNGISALPWPPYSPDLIRSNIYEMNSNGGWRDSIRKINKNWKTFWWTNRARLSGAYCASLSILFLAVSMNVFAPKAIQPSIRMIVVGSLWFIWILSEFKIIVSLSCSRD